MNLTLWWFIFNWILPIIALLGGIGILFVIIYVIFDFGTLIKAIWNNKE